MDWRRSRLGVLLGFAALAFALGWGTPARALTLEDLDGGSEFSSLDGTLTFRDFDITISGALNPDLSQYTVEALVGSVKFAQRYLSERNLPDVALDIIDEAGSEFGVKEEFAKSKIPHLEEQIKELEKLIAACDGKDPEKDREPFNNLRLAYQAFCHNMDLLEGYWGYRVDVQAGEEA